MKIKAAVIGLGMGRFHAAGYQDSAKADLVALCDLDEGLLATYKAMYPQVETFTSYEDMLATMDLDAVSVALPNFLHASISKAVMEAGVNVLCEKPMATSAAEAQTMLETARRTGKKLMIHFNYRYTPQAQFLKHYVDEGHLGEIYYARTRWLRMRGIPKLGGWFGQKKLSGGGPLIDLGVHRLDMAMWLMGYPRVKTVSAASHDLLGARLARQAQAKYDVEDLVTAIVRLDNGATLNLEVSWAGGTDRKEDMYTGVFGSEGAVIQRNTGDDYDFEAVTLKDFAGQLTRVSPRQYPSECPSSIDDFARCIIDDCLPEASAENGLEMMRLIDAVYESARENREVVLGE